MYYCLMILRQNSPTAIVIFGGTGDLAQTKLLPALLDLYTEGALPDTFLVVGLSRKEMTDVEYQAFVKESIARRGHLHEPATIDAFCGRLRYVHGSFDEATAYERVKEVLHEFDESLHLCTNKLFYLAVPPQYYEAIFTHLSDSKALALCDGVGSWSRLLVEKPFGNDLDTDHYLAKDSIENIISLRFANSIVSDSWNKERIESIEIRLLETKDVANRGSFYDGIGTLRDVGQNHMVQMLALLTMQAVDVHDAQSVRSARTAALQTLLRELPDSIVRGQYRGYRGTPGVAEDSQTETYFKLSLVSEAPEWKGVRFTLEAGKALDTAVNEAIVTFRPLNQCHCAFLPMVHEHRNVLRITFAPEHRIALSMWIKKPGFTFELERRELELLHTASTDTHSPEAYERVLFDCIAGDQTRFVSGAEVEAAWRFITPILDSFATLPLALYEPGSAGPHVLI